MLSHHNLALSGHGTHIISAIASVIALYSASVLDLDIVFYFFAHQDIKLGPRNTAKSPLDFISSVLPVQSALENAMTIVDGDRRMRKAESMVCLRK
jgi:hypothetical protein